MSTLTDAARFAPRHAVLVKGLAREPASRADIALGRRSFVPAISLLILVLVDAMGAAGATRGAVVVRSVGHRAVLPVHTEKRPLDRAYMRVYATIRLVAGGLLPVEST